MARSSILALDISDENTHPQHAQMRKSLRAQAAFFIRHPSPLLIASLVVATGAFRLALGGFGLGDLLLAFAVMTWWPLQEWTFHKYLLHLRPIRVGRLRWDPMFARAHRAHHRQPWIVETTMLPVRVVLALIPITIATWIIAMPSLPLAFTGMASYAAMALLYEWTHYLTHSAYEPRSRYYRRIWKNHRLHHFKNERFWYAFTVPLVDRILNTDPGDGASRSETARTLGYDDDPLNG
jgi:hypothetical protein